MSDSSSTKKWIIIALLIVLGGGSLCVCGGVGLTFFGVSKGLGSAEPTVEGVKLAQAHPAVIQALGEPIEVSGFPMGSVQATPAGSFIQVNLGLKGPRGEARLFIHATKPGQVWTYKELAVELPDGQRVELRQADSSAPDPSAVTPPNAPEPAQAPEDAQDPEDAQAPAPEQE